MPPPPSEPPRKFNPEPIEQTTKSSRRRPPAAEDDAPKPRRFAPEPVETSFKSSKDTRRSPPQAGAAGAAEEQPKPARRFAPQIVEQSQKSGGKDDGVPAAAAAREKPHIRFKPEPVATTHRSNRKRGGEDDRQVSPGGTSSPLPPPPPPPSKETGPRKFAPVLLATAKRSRKVGQTDVSAAQIDKTESGYGLAAHEHRRHIAGEDLSALPDSEGGSEDGAKEGMRIASSDHHRSSLPRRQLSPLDGSAPARSSCLTSKRQHSFRMPELDTIESSESERDDSNPSTLSSSPRQAGSPVDAALDSSDEFYKHATRIRESVDENFAHYLLDLERKNARQRLEEQALAAFPNSDFGYEPPHHYVNNDDDSDDMEVEDRPVTWEGHDEEEDEDEEEGEERDLRERAHHRDSTAIMSWEQTEAQRHAEEVEQERRANRITAKKQSDHSPWWQPDDAGFAASAVQPDRELKSMRDRARPPMLGGDLVFPRCSSPAPARFDVTQSVTTLRNQMCHLTEQTELEERKAGPEGGLWNVPAAEGKPAADTATNATVKVKAPEAKGLWGGFCVHDDDDDGDGASNGLLTVPFRPTGLMTPKVETGNPFQQTQHEPSNIGIATPPTPPRQQQRRQGVHQPTDLAHIDGMLVAERDLDEVMAREFPDSFITQVYNYLSLGYPSLARAFDPELAKIARLPLADLRRDDRRAHAAPRGYIRLGPDFEGGGGDGYGDGDGAVEEPCMRWRALKRYVREWARQEKNMVRDDRHGGNWGTGARRGSWAF